MAHISAAAMADLAPMRDFLDEVNTKCGLRVDEKAMDAIALALHQNNFGLVRDLKTLSSDWMEALGMPNHLAAAVLATFALAKNPKPVAAVAVTPPVAKPAVDAWGFPLVDHSAALPVALPVNHKQPEHPHSQPYAQPYAQPQPVQPVSGVAAFALIDDPDAGPAAPGGAGRHSISITPVKPQHSPQPQPQPTPNALLAALPPLTPVQFVPAVQQPPAAVAPSYQPSPQPVQPPAFNASGDAPPPYQSTPSDGAGDALDALNVGASGAAPAPAAVAPPVAAPVIEKSDPLLNALKNAVSHISPPAASNNYMMKGLQNLLTASTAYGDGKQLVLTDCVKQAEQCAQLWHDLTQIAIEENNRSAAAALASTAAAATTSTATTTASQPLVFVPFGTPQHPAHAPDQKSTPPQATGTRLSISAATPPPAVAVSPQPKPVWVPEPCIVCKKPVSGPKEYLECSHSGCAACLNKYLNDAVAANRAVGITCPKDGCNTPIAEHTVQMLLLPNEFAKYLESTVNSFLDQDASSCKCPNPKCGQRLTVGGAGGTKSKAGPVTEKDEQGRVLSAEAFRHFQDFRIRCPHCSINFCSQCKLTPYHKGYTCASWEVYTKSRQCRYCHAKMEAKNTAPNPPSESTRDCCTQAECLEKRKLSCLKMKACGCPCPGLRDEKECLACLKCDLKVAEDFCAICYVEALIDAPCIRLTSCTHVYHFQCVKSKIGTGYNGARITFGFMQCPQDKKLMEHSALAEVSKTWKALRATIEGKAMERLKYECREKDPQIVNKDSPYHNNPPGFAMHQYLFFMCFKCQKPYFAGGYACQEASAGFDPKDLICGSCQPKSENMKECKTHGSDWIAFKCRYCCQFANFFCWSKTHFCDSCHKPGKWTELSTMTTGVNKKAVWDYPQCDSLKGPIAAIQNNYSMNEKQKEEALSKLRADPKQCPVGMRHPPNGFEFGLGCSMCADKDSEDENKHAAAKAKMEEAERKQFAPQFLKALTAAGKFYKYNNADFDTAGILYGIGTYNGLVPKWTNPADRGDVKVSASSLAKESKPLTQLCARDHLRIATENKSDSWICIDLVDKYCTPTFYTLKHPTTSAAEAIKSWRFEASMGDAKSSYQSQWDVLKIHTNENKLSQKESMSVQGPTATFPLPATTKRYRSFRIVQTSKNSGNTYVLALSGFELYGQLYPTAK